MRNVDFKASSFESCKFVGKLSNVIFRGNDESDLYSNPKPNSMYHIDFSEAVFGEYVDFEGCDLSTCVPPKGETFEGLLSRSEYYPNRLGTGCKNCQL